MFPSPISVDLRRMAGKREKHRDRLNQLTDSFIYSEILPIISFKYVVCCSILSSKWRFLWTKMPRLNFSSHDFQNLQPHKIEEIIDGVLHLHSASTLEIFQVEAFLDDYNSACVCKWIEFAALKGVKNITLCNLVNMNTPGRKRRMEVPSSLFACNTLIKLEMVDLAFPKIPTNVEGFHYLKTCYLSHILGLNDEALQQLLGLCPLVENLGFEYCGQLRNLIISTPNLRYLSIEYCLKVKSLKTECPQLREIKLANSIFREDHPWSEFKLLECFSAVESVKSITLINYGGTYPPPNFNFTVLGCFLHLEELTIHGECFEERFMEEEEEPEDVTFPNLKK
ncbi:hypothetical protein KI387_037456, partial [Taxus chinensis]